MATDAHNFTNTSDAHLPVTSPTASCTSPDGDQLDLEEGMDAGQTAEAPYSAFTLWEKRLIVLAASLSAFFSPLTAQIYFPALGAVAEAFGVSTSEINLTVTAYMVLQGVTPMFIGGFADTGGRRPAYLVCFVVYMAANVGVALCQDYAQLLVLRCLQSAGAASTVALCQAVVADTVTSAERGQYIAITVLPIVLAPSLGPVLGGILAQCLGWRAIFWFLAIAAAATFAAMLVFFPETCRNIVGDGSVRPHPVYRSVWQAVKDRRARARRSSSSSKPLADGDGSSSSSSSSSTRNKLKIDFGNPFESVVLLFQPVLGLLLLYSGLVFAGFYAVATSMSEQVKALYSLSDIQVGLMYLPMAAGSIVAAFIIGPGINRNYARHARRLGVTVAAGRQADLAAFPIERARLEIGLPLLALTIAVTFGWGWAIEALAPLGTAARSSSSPSPSIAVPAVLLFLMGVGMVGFQNTINVLITDMHPGKAGAATAANNLTRCLLGAAATAAIKPMIDAVGAGWAFSIFGFLYLLGAPVLLLIMRNGVAWRRALRAKEARADERRRARKA